MAKAVRSSSMAAELTAEEVRTSCFRFDERSIKISWLATWFACEVVADSHDNETDEVLMDLAEVVTADDKEVQALVATEVLWVRSGDYGTVISDRSWAVRQAQLTSVASHLQQLVHIRGGQRCH